MDAFRYDNGQLHCELVNLDELAQKVGTPTYVYSKHTLLDHYDKIVAAFGELDPLICYSIKSCSNVHIIRARPGRG